MTDYGRIRSTVEPDKLVIDEYSVWISTNIVQVSDESFTGYEFHQVSYGKDEYIKLIDETNRALESQATDIQLALCEVYEMIEGE